MTKARTKGAKRRAKAGRPRGEGPRKPSGRLRQQNREAAAAEELATCPGAAIRARRLGLDAPDADTLRRLAKDGRLSTLLGCLNWSDGQSKPRLPDRAYEGLMRFFRAREAYLSAIGAPDEFPSISSYCDERWGSERDPWNVEHAEHTRRVTARYLAAQDVIRGRPGEALARSAMLAPEEVGPDRVSDAACFLLARAGDALADHFGVDEAR